jgi:hypothetical protein
MATRSNIAIFDKEKGQAKTIYAHWDGYLDGVGATLKEHYTTTEKVEKLISLGDLSSLGKEIEIPEGVKHSFDSPSEGITVFYGRDRGETRTKPITSYVSDSIITSLKENDYLYVWTIQDETWKVY